MSKGQADIYNIRISGAPIRIKARVRGLPESIELRIVYNMSWTPQEWAQLEREVAPEGTEPGRVELWDFGRAVTGFGDDALCDLMVESSQKICVPVSGCL